MCYAQSHSKDTCSHVHARSTYAHAQAPSCILLVPLQKMLPIKAHLIVVLLMNLQLYIHREAVDVGTHPVNCFESMITWFLRCCPRSVSRYSRRCPCSSRSAKTLPRGQTALSPESPLLRASRKGCTFFKVMGR